MAAERDINVKVKLKGADTFKKDMASVSSSMSSGFSEITKGILSADLIKSVLTGIVNGINNTVDAAVDFQSALAGVGKTVDVSDVALKNIGYQLMNLSEEIPVSATELAGLAETAGQLGIASSDIVDFTEVAAAMGVSTNMAAEDAATAMAQIAVVFGTTADDYEKMGSTIIDLGNNYATTESDITDMTQRMAGMAAIVGMSEADTFGLAAAVSSLGIESQAGGSSIQKLLNTIEMAVAGGDVADFAELCGVTADEFTSLWNSDPTEVVLKILDGLGSVEAAGGSAAATLSELGLTQSNVTRTLLGLANAGDYTRGAVEKANEAWDENIALTTEAEKRYTTWASRKQIADNKLANAQVSIGEMFAETSVSNYEYIAEVASNATEEFRKVNLADTVKEANAAYEEQAATIEHTSEMARMLADSLAGMGDYDSLDTAGQEKYIKDLTALQTLIPGVTQVWDEQTMSFKGGTDAMYDAIDASEELAIAQAEATRTQEQSDAYAIVMNRMDELSEAHTIAAVDAKAYKDELDALQEQMNQFNPNSDEYAELYEQWQDVNSKWYEANKTASDLQDEIDDLSETTEEYSYIMDDYSAAADGVEEATKGMIDATSEADTAFTQLETNLQSQSDALDELITEYTEAKDTISDTLGGTVKLFEKVELPEVETPEEMIEGLDSQLQFMEDYSTNMQKAQEMGIDSDLLSSLADGSAESAAILEQLVNATPEELAAIEEKMSSVTAQKEALSAQLADVQTGFSEAASSITETANAMIDGANVSGQAYSTAANNVQAIINGINAKLGTLRTKVTEVNNLTSKIGQGGTPTGSHAAGLGYVPFDGYIAQLHRGEMVLTALEAKAYRAEQFTNYGMLAALDRKSTPTNNNDNRRYESPSNTSVRFGNVYVQKESDVDTLSRKLAKLNTKTSKGVGC